MLRISTFLEPLPHGRLRSNDERRNEVPVESHASTGSPLERCTSPSPPHIAPLPEKQAGAPS